MNCRIDEQNWHKNHLLIVDDSADNTSLLTIVLGAEGYQVDVAHDGYTAISKIETNPPCLVLLDAMMPEIDGFQVAQWIQQNHSYVKILLVTACDKSLVFAKLNERKTKIDGLIYKPINLKELLSQIRAILSFDLPKKCGVADLRYETESNTIRSY